jgi:hypothetical protein
VWAALDVGVEVQPQDVVVVVVLAEAAEPVALEGLGPDRPGLAGWTGTAVRGAVGAVLGVAIVLLGVLTALAVSPWLLGDNDRRAAVTAPAATGGTDGGTTAGPTLGGFAAYAARVHGSDISVYAGPDRDAAPVRSFPAVGDYGAPQTFLVEREQRQPDGVWYQVLLPVRPNGTTGWVRAADVEVMGLPYGIKVHLGSLRLELFREGRLERTFPIGIGTVDTPTPPGRYFIKYLMRPDDQNTLFGRFVYGLSGFSDVVRDVPGGGGARHPRDERPGALHRETGQPGVHPVAQRGHRVARPCAPARDSGRGCRRQSRRLTWSGRRESNPRHQLGRLGLCL